MSRGQSNLETFVLTDCLCERIVRGEETNMLEGGKQKSNMHFLQTYALISAL